MFQVVNVHDGFQGDILKVEFIRLVIIRRNRLGIIVDHDGFQPILSECSDSSNGTPIEFDRGSDTVDTRTEHHDAIIDKVNVVFAGIVGGVEVICVGREFGGNSVNLLDKGGNASFDTESTDGELVGV